jgi:hypothetical protein
VRDGQLSGIESLLDLIHEMVQAQSGVHILLGPPDFLGERFDGVGVGLQLHESGIAACFVEFVHVGALQVFNQLQFEALRVGELADAGGNCFPSGELRGAIAPRSGHEFKLTGLAVRQRTNENGLQNAVLPDIAGVM